MSFRTVNPRANNSSHTRSTASAYVPKPVCPHCRNLGLPHDHWLRESADPNSRIVCAVLLKTECRYCHEFGHTVSRCPNRSTENAKPNIRSPAVPNIPSRSEAPSKPLSNNVFNALDSDSDTSETEREDNELKPLSYYIEKSMSKYVFPTPAELIKEQSQICSYIPVLTRGYADGREDSSPHNYCPYADQTDFPELPLRPHNPTHSETFDTAEDFETYLKELGNDFRSGKKTWADICCDD